MRKVLTATVLALFGLAPALGIACEYEAATSAAATPPAQLASVGSRRHQSSGDLGTEGPAAKAAPKQASDKSKELRRQREGRGIVRQLGTARFKKARPARAFLWANSRNVGSIGHNSPAVFRWPGEGKGVR